MGTIKIFNIWWFLFIYFMKEQHYCKVLCLINCNHKKNIFLNFFWRKDITIPLKSKTREDCISRVQIQYKIEEYINIENITSEKFLSHVNTKEDLTKYFNCKIAQALSVAEKRYVVAYKQYC